MAAKNLKLIRLFTGEELLADVAYDTQDPQNVQYVLRNVVQIIMNPNPNGRGVNIGFAPWGEFVEKHTGITMLREHMLYCETPIAEFVQNYNKNFSPIVTPPTGLIIPN